MSAINIKVLVILIAILLIGVVGFISWNYNAQNFSSVNPSPDNQAKIDHIYSDLGKKGAVKPINIPGNR